MRALGAALVVLAALAAPVAAAPALDGVVWAPQPVRAPVRPDTVQPEAPFVPADVDERSGAIEVGPDRAAALWIDALDVVRVRRLDRSAARLRYARVVGAAATRAVVAEAAVALAPGVDALAQPPGGGDVWIVWASAPARIAIDRPVRRSGRLIWEVAQRRLLAWVDRGGPAPALPVSDGAGALAVQLEAEARLGAALVAAAPGRATRAAVASWRKARALAGLAATRPLLRGQLSVTERDELDGVGGAVTLAGDDDGIYRRWPGGAARWTLRLRGPGVLRVDARGLVASDVAPAPAVAIDVAAAGHLLGTARGRSAPVSVPGTQPPAAFPARAPLLAADGTRLGERISVQVALYPGEHDYEIAVAGGPLALRVASATRRPRVGEALLGTTDEGVLLDDARDAVANAPGASAVLRAAIARAGGAPGAPLDPAARRGLPPLLALWAVAAGAIDAAEAPELVAALPADTPPEVVWYLVVEIGRGAAPGRGDAAVRAMIAAAHGAPPPTLVPALVAALPAGTPVERVRSQRVAALDVAWRAAPLDPSVRDGYRAVWRSSAWSSIPAVAASAAAVPALRWICRADALDGGGALWRIPPGTGRRVEAPPSAADPARAALVPVYVETPPDRPGPIGLAVDGRWFHALGIAPVERLEVAVMPGSHELRVDAPEGTRAWVGLPPARGATVAAEDAAVMRRYWPVTVDGAPARFALPGGDVPGPIEVRLRARHGEGGAKAIVRFDVGGAREVAMAVGGDDAGCAPLDGAGAVSGEVTLVVRPPAGARSVTIEEPGGAGRVVAQVRVRRDEGAPGEEEKKEEGQGQGQGQGQGTRGGEPFAEIERLSRRIAKQPGDARALVARAERLLDVGLPDLARQDVLRLADGPAAIAAARLGTEVDDLVARIDDVTESTHALVPDSRRGPVAIAPGLLGLDVAPEALARAVPAVVAWRRGGPDDALARLGDPRGEPVAEYVAARARAARGEHARAGRALARVYAATDAAPIGFEAALALAAALETPGASADADAAPIGFALAARVRPAIDHPALRRAQAQAASLSRWDGLDGADTSAGKERVVARGAAEPDTPRAAARQALLAAPWPASDLHAITPRTSAGIEVDLGAPTAITAEVVCRALKVAPRPAPCAIELRVDHGRRVRRELARDRVVAVDAGTLGGGRHVLEVGLDGDGADDIAAVRFVGDRPVAPVGAATDGGGHAIAIERRGAAFATSAAQPLAVTVLGPGAVRIEARGIGAGADRTVEVVATPRRGRAITARAAIPAAPDPTVRGDGERGLTVSAPAEIVLVLPDEGPYRLTVRPARGELLARVALRVPRDGTLARPAGPWWTQAPSAGERVPKPALAAPLAGLDADTWSGAPPSAVGTLSAGVAASTDRYDSDDEVARAGRARVDATVDYRRVLGDRAAWLRAGVVARARERTAPVAGGVLELSRVALPLGVTADLSARAFTQAFAGRQASSLDGELRLARRVAVASRLELVPRLDLRATRLDVSPAEAAAGADRGDELDPDVYSDVRFTHPVALTPRLALVATPYQDLTASVAVAATSNADLASIDRAGAAVALRTLVPLPLVGDTLLGAAYRPTYRFADDDRLESFLRHDLAVDLEWSLWTGRTGRLVLALAGDAYVTDGASRTAVGVALRYDLTLGRGLLDFPPDDSPFPDLIEGRLWASTPPDLR